MMNKIIIILALTHFYITTSLKAQNAENFSSLIKQELKSFIDSSKTRSLLNGKNNVYIIRLFRDSLDAECDTRFTLGYIVNNSDLQYISFNYYFLVNTEPVLIYIADSSDLFALQSLYLKRIYKSDLSIVLNKLCNSEHQSISGPTMGEVGCIKKQLIKRQIYYSGHDIPTWFSVFGPGKIIDENEIRKMYPLTVAPLPEERPRPKGSKD